MKLMEDYNKALQALYDHVGFEGDWVIFPIDDCTSQVWQTDGDTVFYADSLQEFTRQEGNYYESDVFKQRFYKKWIYRGADLTMIFTDPAGEMYFSVFDNKKEVKLS